MSDSGSTTGSTRPPSRSPAEFLRYRFPGGVPAPPSSEAWGPCPTPSVLRRFAPYDPPDGGRTGNRRRAPQGAVVPAVPGRGDRAHGDVPVPFRRVQPALGARARADAGAARGGRAVAVGRAADRRRGDAALGARQQSADRDRVGTVRQSPAPAAPRSRLPADRAVRAAGLRRDRAAPLHLLRAPA